VRWDPSEKKIVAEKGKDQVIIWAGRDIALVGGWWVWMGAVAEVKDGTLCAPADFLSLCNNISYWRKE
jgi:hypothetical protein